MTNLLDNWEEEVERMINKREEDMKNSKLDVTMGDLIGFISSLLQAQRERDAEICNKYVIGLTGLSGSSEGCVKCGFPQDHTTCKCAENNIAKCIQKEILNQSNNEETTTNPTYFTFDGV